MSSPRQARRMLLHFVEEKAVLCDELELPLSALGFPSWVSGIEEGECLVLEPRKWDETSGQLSVRVLSYQPDDFSGLMALPATLDGGKLRKIEFISLDTTWLVKAGIRQENHKLQGTKELPEPLQEDFTFRVAIKDLSFQFGSVVARPFVEALESEVELSVANACIRPEFDAVKNYFEKVLGKKRVTLHAQLTTLGKQLLEAKVHSPDIDRINEETLGSVKFEFVKKGILKRNLFAEVDANLHSMEELFSQTPEREAGRGLFKTPQELFELLNVSSAKHYANLRYLSSRHDHRQLKLRFVLDPFSFIFLLTGEEGYHLVWETLNTQEATYVWQMEKRKDLLKSKLEHIQGVLNAIRVHGKLPYVNGQDEGFRRIMHEYETPDKGFVKWKHQLDEMIF